MKAQEPVAWAHHSQITSVISPEHKQTWAADLTQAFSVPLYAHPPAGDDALHRAAEQFLASCKDGNVAELIDYYEEIFAEALKQRMEKP